MMHPRLYMHSLQYATYVPEDRTVTFEIRHASGRQFSFVLTRNQFLSFDDAIVLIERENAYGHYPLGQHIWFHYNAFDASLYKETKHNGRVDFIFASFAEYKTYTHRRLLSLIRLKDEVQPTTSAIPTRTKARAKRHSRRKSKDETNRPHHKRSLSITVQPADQPSAAKRCRRGEREAVSRSADDAHMSYDDEDGPVLSEWHYSNTRQRGDSISSISSVSKSANSSTRLQSCVSTADDVVDCE